MQSALLLAFIGSALGRTFTVVNKCSYTVWPAIFTDLNVGTSVPAVETGWEAVSGSSRAFTVPEDWKAGRIWGRTGCDFSSKAGRDACLTGGCDGGLQCDSKTGTGAAPASIAEWTLSSDTTPDYYDVSLVDGFNLPIQISNSVGCAVADCPVDLNPDCPAELKGPLNANGTAAGCKSACVANLDGNPANSPNCCSGSYSIPSNCPSSGVQYYSYFKSRCPRSYAYAYDESSGTTPLASCSASKKADYTLTFCP